MKLAADNTDTHVADRLAVDPKLRQQFYQEGAIAVISADLAVKGEIRANTHLVIEGRVEGKVVAPEHSVTVTEQGELQANVVARLISIRGVAKGDLTATQGLTVHADGRVEGRVATPHLAVDEGAVVNARMDTRNAASTAAVRIHREGIKERTDRSGS